MPFDAHKNFASSLVATAPSPAASGTSLVVGTGHGGRFPAAPFNATIWPANTIPDPANAEVVRVTAVAGDTLTIARSQEGTSARAIAAGDYIAATVTAKTLTDIEATFDATVVNVVKDYGFVGDDSTDNLAAWNNLKANAPFGARIYFPPGTYRTSGEFTIDVDKRWTFFGAGRYVSIIKTTSATANIFNKTVAGFYDTWSDLGFQSSVTKTAGAAILLSSGFNVGMNCYRLWITGLFKGISAQGSQSGNLSVWADLDISAVPVNGRGIHINGDTINVQIHNTTINCGDTAGAACMEVNQSGAVQVTGSDWIKGENVVLVNGNAGAGAQAVYFTNVFFDQPLGSVVKIIGTNTSNRIKFTQCGIAPTGNNHGIEVAGTGTGGVGGTTALPAGISVLDCDIYAQNGTSTGAGIRLNGAGDVNIQNSRITGFGGSGGSGIWITPSAANQTKVRVNGNIIGPNSNLTVANQVGVRIDAGASALGFLSVSDNSILGSTSAAIIDNSTVISTATKNIKDNQGFLPSLPTITVPAAFTAETVVTSWGLPANYLAVNPNLFIRAIATNTAGTGTGVYRVRIGTAGTTADAVMLVTTATAALAVNTNIQMEFQVAVPTSGATGSGQGQGYVVAGSAVAGMAVTAWAPATINTTVPLKVTITAQHSTANSIAVRAATLTPLGV